MAIKKLLYVTQNIYCLFVEKSMLCNMSITSHSRDFSTFLLVNNDYHAIISSQVNYFFNRDEILFNLLTPIYPSIKQHNQSTTLNIYNYIQLKLIIHLQYYILSIIEANLSTTTSN